MQLQSNDGYSVIAGCLTATATRKIIFLKGHISGHVDNTWTIWSGTYYGYIESSKQ